MPAEVYPGNKLKHPRRGLLKDALKLLRLQGVFGSLKSFNRI